MLRLTNDEVKTILRWKKSTTNSNLRLKKSTAKEGEIESEQIPWCQNVTLKNNTIESDNMVMSHFATSQEDNYFKGNMGGTRKLPHAFTEQGIYMNSFGKSPRLIRV